MGLKGRLAGLQKAMRGKLDHFELADGSRHYFDPEEAGKDNFLYLTACVRADFRREPRPEPPDALRAVAGAKDRRSALEAVCPPPPVVPCIPVDVEALVERGEFVPRPLVAGREHVDPREPHEDEPREDLRRPDEPKAR